jgi:hypothetical protein
LQNTLQEDDEKRRRYQADLCKVMRVFLSKCKEAVELSGDIIQERKLTKYSGMLCCNHFLYLFIFTLEKTIGFQTMVERRYADMAINVIKYLSKFGASNADSVKLIFNDSYKKKYHFLTYL